MKIIKIKKTGLFGACVALIVIICAAPSVMGFIGVVNPHYYIIHKGSLIDGEIEDCESLDGEFIHFRGSHRQVGVHFYCARVGNVGTNNMIWIKFWFTVYAFMIWIYYWDGSYDVLGGPYGFHPPNSWQIEDYPIDNYKAVSDVYIWASGAVSDPDIRIDYLGVHYGLL